MEMQTFMDEIIVNELHGGYIAFFKGKEGYCETGSSAQEAVGRLVTLYRSDSTPIVALHEYQYVLPEGGRVRTEVISKYDGHVSLPGAPRPGEIISLPDNRLFAVSVVRDYPGTDDDKPVIFLREI